MKGIFNVMHSIYSSSKNLVRVRHLPSTADYKSNGASGRPKACKHLSFKCLSFSAVLFFLLSMNWQNKIIASPLNGTVQLDESHPLHLQRPQDIRLETGALNGSTSQSEPSQSATIEKNHGKQHLYKVSWAKWEARVDKAVWAQIPYGSLIYGNTAVHYDVTQDRHVVITSIKSPERAGDFVNLLIGAIMHLQGNPILDFPAGSEQQVHHTWNGALGSEAPSMRTYGMMLIHPHSDVEHVVQPLTEDTNQ